jgi:hypothetical protein
MTVQNAEYGSLNGDYYSKNKDMFKNKLIISNDRISNISFWFDQLANELLGKSPDNMNSDKYMALNV